MQRPHPILRYAWALPATALGLLTAAVAFMTGSRFSVVGGVVEVAGGRFVDAVARSSRFNAITLGHVVIGRSESVLCRCRLHERVHVRQYERWGILFFPLYLGSSLFQILRGRHPYWDNRFERQAYRESALPVSDQA
jgi:hypothetical protein